MDCGRVGVCRDTELAGACTASEVRWIGLAQGYRGILGGLYSHKVVLLSGCPRKESIYGTANVDEDNPV